MSREFELRKEIELAASPEQVWEAIATGPGITSWFMSHEVVPGVGGSVTLRLGDFEGTSAITAWDPPSRFATRGGTADEPHTVEYLVEGRAGGSAVLRLRHTGFTGDDWEGEYQATSAGWDMYLHTLAQYVAHFPGRTAIYVSAQAPASSADPAAWSALLTGLGFTDSLAEGDRVRLDLDGQPSIDGVADYVRPTFVGIRTGDALYRFHGRAVLGLPIAVGHHLYSADVDGAGAQKAWQAWLDRLLS
jgi:uncharacterized protein YndB with AHSA1/START domain